MYVLGSQTLYSAVTFTSQHLTRSLQVTDYYFLSKSTFKVKCDQTLQ